MTILHIETTTDVCSIALSCDGKVLFHRLDMQGHNHARVLPLFVDEALSFLKEETLQLDAVALSRGPGSYTGLRIGCSMAKGICYGIGAKLIAVDTLKLMASMARSKALEMGADCLSPMIDARRMEVYDELFDTNLNELEPVAAQIIDEDSFGKQLLRQKVVFLGNGSDKCREVLKHKNALFLKGIYPDAACMVSLSEEAFAKKEFVDVAYYEPFYLKEFQATTPKNKVI